MVQCKVEIVNLLGLHLRAAARLVKKAAEFESEIEIRKNDVVVDAKSIMAVLGLEGSKGSEIEITATGRDEDDALRQLVSLVEKKFYEEEWEERDGDA
jgi:phosphotransferase system HPr (HPr) family protein